LIAKGLSLLTRKTLIGYNENDLANYANILDSAALYIKANAVPQTKIVKSENVFLDIFRNNYILRQQNSPIIKKLSVVVE